MVKAKFSACKRKHYMPFTHFLLQPIVLLPRTILWPCESHEPGQPPNSSGLRCLSKQFRHSLCLNYVGILCHWRVNTQRLNPLFIRSQIQIDEVRISNVARTAESQSLLCQVSVSDGTNYGATYKDGSLFQSLLRQVSVSERSIVTPSTPAQPWFSLTCWKAEESEKRLIANSFISIFKMDCGQISPHRRLQVIGMLVLLPYHEERERLPDRAKQELCL